MSKAFVLGVDLDGVCADYVGAFREYVAMRKNVPVTDIGPATNWEFHLAGWPIAGRDEYMELHRDFVRDGGFTLERPIEGARDALWELSDAGVYIRIVTHRLINSGSYEHAVIETARWLQTHDIPFRGLCFERHKADTGCDMYVDDSPGNIAELQREGKHTVVFDAPYNQPPETLGLRAYSWANVVDHVLNYAQVHA